MATKMQIRINKPGKTHPQTYAQVTNSGIEPDAEGDTFMDARSQDLEESEIARRELLGQLMHAFSAFEIWTPTEPGVFVSTIPSYNYNQELNKDHVKALAMCIMATKEIIGVLITCEFEDGTIILIDGHHRLEALKSIIIEKELDSLTLSRWSFITIKAIIKIAPGHSLCSTKSTL
jgi:hypothetical protein